MDQLSKRERIAVEIVKANIGQLAAPMRMDPHAMVKAAEAKQWADVGLSIADAILGITDLAPADVDAGEQFLRIHCPTMAPIFATGWMVEYTENDRTFYFPRRHVSGIPLSRQWVKDWMAAAWYASYEEAEATVRSLEEHVARGSLKPVPLKGAGNLLGPMPSFEHPDREALKFCSHDALLEWPDGLVVVRGEQCGCPQKPPAGMALRFVVRYTKNGVQCYMPKDYDTRLPLIGQMAGDLAAAFQFDGFPVAETCRRRIERLLPDGGRLKVVHILVPAPKEEKGKQGGPDPSNT